MNTFLVLAAITAYASPAPFPVFLKQGFSSVLEFESPPTQVVLGDAQSFQVERMNRSLVIRALVPSSASNLFVYFKESEAKLFLLTASDESDPTIYRKFEQPIKIIKPKMPVVRSQASRITSAKFSGKKDYLTVEAVISAGPSAPIVPIWDGVRLTKGSAKIFPTKLWSERKQIQKDTSIQARFIFTKPNLSSDLKGASIEIPVVGLNPITLNLGGK